jgi:hypothetical protein
MQVPIEVKIRIDGVLYDQIETPDLNEGDLVFDTKDNTYGFVDMRRGDQIAIRENCVTEVGVPISRVRKLIPSLLNNSLN